MRIVFVGQQPSKFEDNGLVLPIRPGSSGDRIVKMMGITEQAFRDNFDCINVSSRHDPDGFDPENHKVDVDNIRSLLRGRKVVLLGPAVAHAFDIDRSMYQWTDWFDHPKWIDHHGLFTVIPHPSGANRLYNDPSMFELVRRHLDFMWQQRDMT
jgi:uracil-DNA glycosylase